MHFIIGECYIYALAMFEKIDNLGAIMDGRLDWNGMNFYFVGSLYFVKFVIAFGLHCDFLCIKAFF